jgi:hypothetical protein
MSIEVKKEVSPRIFDRVHNDIYGYGTVIGVAKPNVLVLFDKTNGDFHAGGDYKRACDSWVDVSSNVRTNRCYWCAVLELSTSLDETEREERNVAVYLVPFDSEDYKEHPIRVVVKIPYIPMFNGSIVLRNEKGECLILCDDGGYCWVKIERLSLLAGALGTGSSDAWPKKEEGAEEKDEDTVASPYYYKIARVEPNELMGDLMSFEQHEGFLWGNIIKYTYRYGNKGEKAETVKKIRKYCDMLLEILEPKSELED